MNEKECGDYIKKLVLDEINKFECIKQKSQTEEKQNDKITKQRNEIPSIMINGHVIKYNPEKNGYDIITQEETDIGIHCEKNKEPWSDGKSFGCIDKQLNSELKDNE